MPIQTRSQRQSTIDFPARKTQTPGRSLHSFAKNRGGNLHKIVNEGGKVHSRSRSLSSLSQDKQSPPKPGAPMPVKRLAERLDFVLSPTKHNSKDESPNKKEGVLSPVRSPRKQSMLGQGNKESPSKNKSAVSPVKSPRKRSHSVPLNDENQQPADCSPSETKRACVIDEDCIMAEKLTPKKTSQSCAIESPIRKLCISRQDGECYSVAKKALHTSQPSRMLCRERELTTIQAFLKAHLTAKRPGSLYISGPPGTGKTACIHQILQQDKSLTTGVQHVFINCMLIRQSQGIYSKVLKEVTQDESTDKMSAKMAAKALQKTFTSRGPAVLLVLDEIDHLDSRGQEVLYTMFEWPSLPRSRLVLIGVANALDLTDRILPRLQSRPRCKPELLHFAPYTRDELATILQDRLRETTVDGVSVVEPMAVQLCARKVAAVAGDVRKALDVCRRAVEVVQADIRTQSVLTPKAGSPRKLPGSPQKSRSPRKQLQFAKKPLPKKVGLVQVSSVINEVYGSGAMTSSSSSSGGGQSFPLQQKLAVCTLLLMVKEGKSREVTLGKVHDTYRKICASRQVVPVDQSEFLSLCQLVETRGVLAVKKSKDARQSKMSLKMNEKEVEFALQDKVLLSAILQAGLPRNDKNKKL